MKRKILLYIGDTQKLADLGDDTFILFNWENWSIGDPAKIKNGWSRQITLPGTARNDLLFGQIFRNDRVTVYNGTGTGIYFDAARRTPFTAYDEASNPVAAGYLKLDEIEVNGPAHDYKVTLYGGLGGFLYGLTYNEDGSKRTLADLAYKINGAYPSMDFTISAATVGAAWANMLAGFDSSSEPSTLYDIINFAPCYNGIPKGSFSPKKGIVNDPAAAGLTTSVTEDGVTYGEKGGAVIVTFPSDKTEWEVKDLRSYLQRPVFRLSSIIEACCNPSNNGGYTIDTSSVDLYGERGEEWLTLPLLTTLDLNVEGERGTFSSATISGSGYKTYTIPSAGGTPTQYTIDIVPKIAATGSIEYLDCYDDEGNDTAHYVNYIEVLAHFRQAGQLIDTKVFRLSSGQVESEIQPNGGYVTHIGYFDATGAWVGPPMQVSWSTDGNDPYDEVEIAIDTGGIVEGSGQGASPIPGYTWDDEDDLSSRTAFSLTTTVSGEYGSALSPSARSFVTVKKADLLGTSATPADYLVSWIKRNNYRLIVDETTKTGKILLLEDYYNGSTINLDNRINRSKPITVRPFAFEHRFYAWGEKYGGEYAKYYENVYGKTYGWHYVDTGYEFDAETVDVMAGTVFTGAVSILEDSKYYCTIADTGAVVPSAFLDSGATYDLYDKDGKTKQMAVPYPSGSAVKTWLNSSYPSFDAFDKPQFHNENNAPYDTRDTILIFHDKIADVAGMQYRLTDDTTAQMSLNDNTPCWMLDGGTTLTDIPLFQRFAGYNNPTLLDYGAPAEIPVPDMSGSFTGHFNNSWGKYVTDLYDDDSKVVRCWVNLEGIGVVGPELLRNFYHFDGAFWSLNKIINYSLTTWDDTECEFVKVQDRDNYNN